jgi:hypothetical protein
MRNCPPIRTILIASMLAVAFSLVSLLSRNTSTLQFYFSLGLLVIVEATVRLAARRSAVLLAGQWTVRMTDDTFALQTAVSHAEVSWNAYRDAWERSRFWYLRQLNGPVSFIPKRAFGDAQQAELAEFFARRLPPSKIRWFSPHSWR